MGQNAKIAFNFFPDFNLLQLCIAHRWDCHIGPRIHEQIRERHIGFHLHFYYTSYNPSFPFLILLRRFVVSNLILKYLALMDSVKCILVHLFSLKRTSHYSYQLATHVAALGANSWPRHRNVSHYSFL